MKSPALEFARLPAPPALEVDCQIQVPPTPIETPAADEAIKRSLKAKPTTQRDIARWARRKKLLDKMRDADIEALLALCRAYQDSYKGADDALFDAVCDKMTEDRTYEQFEMLCLEVLELRKRLRRLGMDSNLEPPDDVQQANSSESR